MRKALARSLQSLFSTFALTLNPHIKILMAGKMDRFGGSVRAKRDESIITTYVYIGGEKEWKWKNVCTTVMI